MAKLIGTDPNQVPTNADLGTMAYQDSESVRVQTIRADTAVGAGVDINDDLGDNRFVVADKNHGLVLDYVGATLPYQAGMFTSNTAHTQTAYGDLNIKARTDYGGNYGIGFFTAASNNNPQRAMTINSSGLVKSRFGEFLGFEDDINILNHDPEDGGTDFDQTPTNNSDGGGTTWAPRGEGYAIGFTSTSGGHGGTWMKVYCDEGLWAIKGSVRLTNTDGAVHGGTDADNYKFTHSFQFYISGGPNTGTVKFDADAAASANGTDFTRIAFSGAPAYLSAGYKSILYATNGYEGVQQIYITDLRLVRVG